ncbi:30S ribosomal protein S8 [candidate division WOR-3 bacterium]|nr:30S ribosomal protein S8 [candidate division WOR-3 bacterium]
MMINDPVGDMLARIRNSLMREVYRLELPSTNILEGVASVLLNEGYIEKYETRDESPQKVLLLYLKVGTIRGLKRISKPSRRVYVNLKNMPRVKEGLGIAIISTSKGILSDRMARKEKVGGEILAFVW